MKGMKILKIICLTRSREDLGRGTEILVPWFRCASPVLRCNTCGSKLPEPFRNEFLRDQAVSIRWLCHLRSFELVCDIVTGFGRFGEAVLIVYCLFGWFAFGEAFYDLRLFITGFPGCVCYLKCEVLVPHWKCGLYNLEARFACVCFYFVVCECVHMTW